MEENSIKDKKRFVCANAFYEGREYYYCLKKIPSYNWTMLFLVSADHVATNTMDMVNSIIRTFALVAACAFTILCSGFFVWYRSRRTRAMYEFELRTNECLSEVNQELEKAKKAAEEAFHIAEEANQSKSRFLSNMSHDMRTPMNAIVGFTTLLDNESKNPEKVQEYTKKIAFSSQHLLGLINDVLDLSKIEAGHIELVPVWCNLSDLIDESCTECQPNVPEGVTLKKRYPATPNLIKQDPMRIKQVLSNLISNALKNTVQGYVEISYETTPSETKISVSDTGRGIPEDKLGIIFERFEKADTFIQGAGLGLPICKSIMEHMNGTIEVTSTVNKGSTFTVVFPCQVRPME